MSQSRHGHGRTVVLFMHIGQALIHEQQSGDNIARALYILEV